MDEEGDNRGNVSINMRDNYGNVFAGNTFNVQRLEELGLAAGSNPRVNAQKLKLYDVLLADFSLQELGELSLRLGVDFELFGTGGKADRARLMVEYLDDHDQLDALEARVRELRPAAFE